MKKITILLSLFALLLASASAQTILTPTTLSSAVADGKVQVFTVTSASPNATTVNNFLVGNQAYVDRELVTIKAVSGTTISVSRGQGGTAATPHANGAYIFVAQPFLIGASDKSGKCTRGNEPVLPVINVKSGMIFDCLGGSWEQGDPSSGTQVSAKFRIVSPDSGGTVYTSLNSAGTTLGATTLYCTEVVLPSNKLLTGIALLNGTTVGTDKHYVVLYDNAGNALANSAVAGTTTAGASTYQTFAFTSTYFAIGPAQYFACFQSNGTTDTVRMVVTGTQDNLLTKGQTAVTFGTIPALTVPTTFTTAVGAYVYLY